MQGSRADVAMTRSDCAGGAQRLRARPAQAHSPVTSGSRVHVHVHVHGHRCAWAWACARCCCTCRSGLPERRGFTLSVRVSFRPPPVSVTTPNSFGSQHDTGHRTSTLQVQRTAPPATAPARSSGTAVTTAHRHRKAECGNWAPG
eukprot:5099679-Prymnesium_polylepis.1